MADTRHLFVPIVPSSSAQVPSLLPLDVKSPSALNLLQAENTPLSSLSYFSPHLTYIASWLLDMKTSWFFLLNEIEFGKWMKCLNSGEDVGK